MATYMGSMVRNTIIGEDILSPIKDHTSRRSFLKALGAAGGMVVLGSGVSGCITGSSSEGITPGPTGNLTYAIVNRVSAKFAEYTPMAVTANPSLKTYSVLPDLSKVVNLDKFPIDENCRNALASNLFYMRSSGDEQIYDVYKHCKDAGIPAFVTADTVLHAYHILFDNILRMLEVSKFSPSIEELSQAMLDESRSQACSGIKEVCEAALKNMAFFGVALTLLGKDADVPSEVRDMIDREIALIDAHSGFDVSLIFGYDEDYSQYVPRGHYTRNDTLKKYFRAMMWYGRMFFPFATVDEDYNKLQARRAIMITMSLKSRPFDLWSSVYEPTVFFVGETDDLSVYDYNGLIREVYGDTVSLSDLSDDAKILSFIEKAKKLRAPKIISTDISDGENKDKLKGFRFMGQRFIPDSYIFQELVYDKVGTVDFPRLFPMGLDVMAVLGSKRAYDILDKLGETGYAKYKEQFESLKQQFAAFGDDTWTQNLYWCWLYCLMALLNEKGEGYPAFMTRQAWTDKELNTSLGSWAELRHDTILYAKQSYTLRATAIMPHEESAKGYVEPNAELYSRLASLAKMTIDGLSKRGLLIDEFGDKLQSLYDTLVSLKQISEKELTSTPLTEEENSLIEYFGSRLEGITTFSPEINDSISCDADKKMAIIADVHTDVNTEMVLEEGVGNPYHIYVVVEVNGVQYLMKGGAFSYYEFKHPMGDRLTDEKWQQMLKEGKAPEVPEWTKSFVVLSQ